MAGRSQPSWDSLELVSPGDVIFHYAKNKLRGISSAVSASRTAEIRIKGKGQWKDLGREVEVIFQDFDFAIALHEIPIELRLGTQTGINTPFDVRGGVKQGYLFGVSDELAKFVFAKLKVISDTRQPIENQVRLLLGDFKEGTDKAILGTTRREQRALRQSLIGNQETATCGICGRTLGAGLLVAAHIKPRSNCSEKERLDPNVVMLACLLGCDALFEKGAIYVDQKGFIRNSGRFANQPDLFDFLTGLDGRISQAYNENTQQYFEWHRNTLLK